MGRSALAFSLLLAVGSGAAAAGLVARAVAVPPASGLRVPAPPPADQIPSGHTDFQPIGSQECRICHRAIYRAWADGPHARSAAVLEPAERDDDSCRPCHVPYPGVEEAVGCEACHGPGSGYASLEVMLDPFKRGEAGLLPANDSCAPCHRPGHPFHVERDLAAAARTIHPAPPLRIVP